MLTLLAARPIGAVLRDASADVLQIELIVNEQPAVAATRFVAEEAPKYHDGPVQVFVLAGQSNMLGYGLVEPTDSHGGDYTLEALVASGASAYQHLRDSVGEWTVRDDVDVEVYGAVNKKSKLTVGLGADEQFFGPEMQSGHVLGERLSQKVLLIKVAWGGKSLHGKTQPLTL